MPQFFQPDLLWAEGRAHEGAGLLVDDEGRVLGVVAPDAVHGATRVRLAGKALLPGLANAHSHSFQRLFRGRAEGRITGGDTFWTWREQMYKAASFVAPEDLYEVSRAVFLEMLSAGITAVGEFHYLHQQPDGRPYEDGNTLALAVVCAAQSVGLRLCLLRTAYMRAGFQKEPHAGQRRFYEFEDVYLKNLDALRQSTKTDSRITVGAAPHSIRAVPLASMERIAAYAQEHALPLHMHMSEQPAENEACVAEYGQTPVSLTASRGLLTERTTLVHAIHLSDAELRTVAQTEATICSCPTTERNLGDGIFPADAAARLGVHVAFGTDSEAQIDILEDARQNEYHLRLLKRERGILDGIDGVEVGARLLRSATAEGYRSLGLPGGSLRAGEAADFFTVDLNDVSLMGMDAETLASQAVFAAHRAAIRDVAIGGQLRLTDGKHENEEEIRASFGDVLKRFRER